MISLELCIPELQKSHTLMFTNVMGQLLVNQNISSSQATLDISNLPAGLYFVRVDDGAAKRLVINR